MKKLLKVLGIFTLVFALVGCIKVDINLNVHEDGTVDASVKELFNESMMKSFDESWSIDKALEDTKSSGTDQITSTVPNAKTEKITETIDGVKWVGIQYTGTMDAETTKEMVKVEKDKLTLTFDLTSNDNEDSLEGGNSFIDGKTIAQLQSMASSGASFTATITMPQKITSNITDNVGIVIKDNVATIDFLKCGSARKLELTCSTKAPMNMALIGGCVAAVVVVVGAFLVLKGKKK